MSSNIPHNPVPRILVVEDHPAELRVLADILENEAFAVSGATSAEKALQLVRAEQFAAAIVDLSLPDQSGIDLIREINRVDPHLRIIIHTGQASFETAKEAVNLHVFAYVEKLGDPGELVRYAHRAANDYLSEQLRQRELRYRTLYDRTPAMLSSIDLQGRLVGVSDYWLSKLGYRRDDVLGHRLSEFFAESSRDQVERVCSERLFGEGSIADVPAQMLARGGENIDVLLSGTVDRDLDGVVREGILVCVDVTRRNLAEARAREHLAELAHVTRVSAMGQLVAELAHEISQPLYAINNFAQAIEHRLKDNRDPDIRDWIGQIIAQSRRTSEVIRSLQRIARKTPPRQTTADINDVVQEMASLLGFDARSHQVAIELQLGDDLPQVLLDRIQIEQVLVNLVRNAIDAMQQVPVEQRRLVVRTSAGEDAVDVEVIDRGPGIAEEIRDRLFEPYLTTKAEGMGMGLPICRSILQQHGGTLQAQANPEGGAIFHFSLPVPVEEVVHVPAADGLLD